MKNYEQFERWLTDGASPGAMGDETEYPIAGCRELLSGITARVRAQDAQSVLCMGAGSESIARDLYADGCEVYLIDMGADRAARFSGEMPGAHVIHCDFLDEIPEELYENEFDAVVFTYSAHVLSDEEKLWLIDDLADLLSESGVIYVGDVCFWTSAEREICRRRCRGTWDEDAGYIVYDDLRLAIAEMYEDGLTRFTRFSHCTGLVEFSFAFFGQ